MANAPHITMANAPHIRWRTLHTLRWRTLHTLRWRTLHTLRWRTLHTYDGERSMRCGRDGPGDAEGAGAAARVAAAPRGRDPTVVCWPVWPAGPCVSWTP